MRDKLKHVSENFHEFIHLSLGLIAAWLLRGHETDYSTFIVIFSALLGTFLPDLDHFFSWFIYSKSSEYAQQAKFLLKKFKLKSLVKFCKENHKFNNRILSHNFLSFLFVLILTVYSLKVMHDIPLTAMFLAWTFHYLYDMVEDLLFFGKLNSNWFLNFKLPDDLIISEELNYKRKVK